MVIAYFGEVMIQMTQCVIQIITPTMGCFLSSTGPIIEIPPQVRFSPAAACCTPTVLVDGRELSKYGYSQHPVNGRPARRKTSTVLDLSLVYPLGCRWGSWAPSNAPLGSCTRYSVIRRLGTHGAIVTEISPLLLTGC